VTTLILCDRDSTGYHGLDLGAAVASAVRDAELVRLDGDATRPCLGCFQCWVKTPGICRLTRDDTNSLARREMRADAVVLVSRITYGGYSYDTKAFLDRTIQNLAPYFEIVDRRMRHAMRYERFPVLITLGYGDCTDKETDTFVSLAHHNALNMRPPRHAVFTARGADAVEAAVGQVVRALKEGS